MEVNGTQKTTSDSEVVVDGIVIKPLGAKDRHKIKRWEYLKKEALMIMEYTDGLKRNFIERGLIKNIEGGRIFDDQIIKASRKYFMSDKLIKRHKKVAL